MERLLAEVTMVAHLATWRLWCLAGSWPGGGRGRWPHLVGTGCGVVIVTASLDCPLTYVEDRLRRRAGQPGLPRGFVDTYIEGVLYPAEYAGAARALAATLIVLSWLGVYLIQRRRLAASRRPMSMPASATVTDGPARGTRSHRGRRAAAR